MSTVDATQLTAVLSQMSSVLRDLKASADKQTEAAESTLTLNQSLADHLTRSRAEQALNSELLAQIYGTTAMTARLAGAAEGSAYRYNPTEILSEGEQWAEHVMTEARSAVDRVRVGSAAIGDLY